MNRVFLALILLTGASITWAESGTLKRRPLPSEYGRVVINNYSKQAGISSVIFDHWSHRSKFTCRLCHVDIGFSMVANGTKIRADSNSKGTYCGTCHNGKMMINSSIIFPACKNEYTPEEYMVCNRCHRFEPDARQEEKFIVFVKKMPSEKFGNGINWPVAEQEGRIKLIDDIEGLSSQARPSMKIKNDKILKMKLEGMPNVIFSHKTHTVWGGCKLCHPDLFSFNEGRSKFSMNEIFEGKSCGACHKTVAFPLADCRRCHTGSKQG